MTVEAVVVLTKAQRRALTGYYRDLADRMRLTGWRVGFDFEEPADEENDAETHVSIENHRGRTRLGKTFFEITEDVQRKVLVHELLHLHLEVPWHMVEYDLREHLNRLARELFMSSWRRQMEMAIDDISRIISARMPPLPDDIPHGDDPC